MKKLILSIVLLSFLFSSIDTLAQKKLWIDLEVGKRLIILDGPCQIDDENPGFDHPHHYIDFHTSSDNTTWSSSPSAIVEIDDRYNVMDKIVDATSNERPLPDFKQVIMGSQLKLDSNGNINQSSHNHVLIADVPVNQNIVYFKVVFNNGERDPSTQQLRKIFKVYYFGYDFTKKERIYFSKTPSGQPQSCVEFETYKAKFVVTQ